LNIRGTAVLRIREDLEAAKESDRDSNLFIPVTSPGTLAETDPFLNYIHDVQRPSPMLDLHPVESRISERAAGVYSNISLRQRDGTKEIRMEWRPAQDQSRTLSPPENENSCGLPPLVPNRLNQDASTSSSALTPSK
ncbi:hypothetical protein AAF712_016467, partial [Marasmius tenuissimus]